MKCEVPAAVAAVDVEGHVSGGDGMVPSAQFRYEVSPERDVCGSWSGTPGAILPRPGFAEPDRPRGPEAPPAAGPRARSEAELAAAAEAFVGMSMTEIERYVIEATVRACGDSLPRAARMLGLSPSTLYRKRSRWDEASNGGPSGTPS